MGKKCFRSTMAALCLALAVNLPRPAAASRAQAGPADAGAYRGFFDRALPAQLEEFHIAGAAVAVVENGEPVFAKGYGFADVEDRIAADPDATLFRIGSTTKLFVWTAVMQLVERGEVDLDADINSYLDFRIPDTYPEPITLRRLMTHSAGFEDRITGYLAASGGDQSPLGAWLAGNIPARVRAPGVFSSYSNYGAGLAGYIVERVSGIPFARYAEKNIFAPLGMNRTSLDQPIPAAWAGELSKGYVFTGADFQSLDFEYIVPAPTGSATSTAADMARFMTAILGGGANGHARILGASTAATMLTRIFGHDPLLNGWAYGLYEMSRNGVRALGHAGDTRLFHSLLALIPEKNIGVFVVYNSENAFDAQSLLLEEFMDAFFPAALPPAAKLELSAEELAKFAGSYRQTRRFAETTVEKAGTLFEPILMTPTADGALLLSSAWYGEIRFIPVEPLEFVQEDDPQNRLIFRTDADGIITRAFAQDDPTTAFEKMPWHADYTLHYLILIGSAGLFLATLLAALVCWIVRRFVKNAETLPRAAVIGRRIFPAIAAAGLLFPAGFVLAFGGIAYGDTTLLSVVLALPVLLLVLSIGAGYFLVRAWEEKYWCAAERILYSLVLMVSAGFLWSLNYWNLLGWKY
ncbi:MAG: beta-lactamase family protein [Anaerolineales bacterium]|nr:beta-lactamase family protein [Anaerolineales bacterium]